MLDVRENQDLGTGKGWKTKDRGKEDECVSNHDDYRIENYPSPKGHPEQWGLLCPPHNAERMYD
jgi:hypothetical protein